MKFICICLLCITLFACSKNESAESYNSRFTLDSLAKLDGSQLLELDSNAQESIFAGTRQEVFRENVLLRVNIASAKMPPSNRHGIPSRWETSQGVYVGIPLDSIEAINGMPFYISLFQGRLYVENWEGGKLANKGVFVEFAIEKGGSPEAFMSSKDILAKGWKVRCIELKYYPTGWIEPKEPSHGFPGYYPGVSYKVMTDADLTGLRGRDLRLMRNEIFARHGYIFKSEDLQTDFSELAWYKPSLTNVDDQISEIEKANIKLILAREATLRNNPLANTIRKLPFLQLPLDPDQQDISAGPLDPTLETPDWPELRDGTRFLHGLLPDTTLCYAVVWSSVDIGGISRYVTTVDKFGDLIETIEVSAYNHTEQGETSCRVQESLSSVINRNWSFKSTYHAIKYCPTAGDDLKVPIDQATSGQILKDGSTE